MKEEVVKQPVVEAPAAVAATETEKRIAPASSRIGEYYQEMAVPVPTPVAVPVPTPVAVPESTPIAAQTLDEFTITLKKTSESSRLGVTVDISSSVCMVVDKVTGGLFAEWNASNTDLEVKPGDEINSVNGQYGDAVELTQICKDNDVLEIKIVRAKAR